MARTEITDREVTRKGGKEKVIDITSSLREILGDRTLSTDEIEDRLLEFAGPILEPDAQHGLPSQALQ